MKSSQLPFPTATCTLAAKSRSYLAWLSLTALLALGSHGYSQAVNCTWTGGAATDLMSEKSNWEGAHTPADEAINSRDIIFGPLPDGAHRTVGVDLDRDRNLGPVIFSEGAPAMTLRPMPPNVGLIQFAHLNERLRLVNHSGQKQTFQIEVHLFWQAGEAIPIQRLEAESGDFAFEHMVALRSTLPGATPSGDTFQPQYQEAEWQLAGSGNMTFAAVRMPTEGHWPPETNLSLIKTGSGRVTFQGEANWRGSATVEEGVLAADGVWAVTCDILIGPNATLEGSGQIEAPVRVQGKLSPGGAEIATLKFAKGLELSGTTEMSLDAATKSSDCANVTSGPLTYGGVLRVNSTGPSKFTRGQVFQLFQWKDQPPAGAFTKVEFPALPSGLRWTDNLCKDGTIIVGP